MWTARQKQRSSFQKQFSLDIFQKVEASSSSVSSLAVMTRDELQNISAILCPVTPLIQGRRYKPSQ
jgi:hypothetical protein